MRYWILFVTLIGCAIAACAYPSNLSLSSHVSSPFNAGIGAGVMYGEYGANLEYHHTQQISSTVGIGLDGHGNWFAGVRYYLKPEGAGPRARVSVGYGTVSNRVLGVSSNNSEKVVFAIGGSWANADTDYRGWDIDLSTAADLSFGYHF